MGGVNFQATNQKVDKITQFFSRVVPWPTKDEPGFINVHWKLPGKRPGRKFFGCAVHSVDELYSSAKARAQSTGADLYFCLSLQAIAGERKAKNALAFKAIWIDLDIKAGGYSTPKEAIDALFDFIADYDLPPPSAIVVSGNGLHVYWISNRVLLADEWRSYAEGLKAAALQWGLKCDAGVIANAAQVLRVPGTRNFKTDPPKPVSLSFTQPNDIDFATELKGLLDIAPSRKSNGGGITDGQRIKIAEAFKHLKPNQSLGAGIEEDFPLQPFPPIKAECAWLREAHDTGGKEFDQPQWNLTTLCAVFLEDGHQLAHQFGNQHPEYTPESTDELWARKNREHEENGVNWPGCKAIQDAGSKHCKDCPHLKLGKSPLHLGLKSSNQANQTGYFDFVGTVAPEHKLLQTSAEFVAGFVPPDYLIDGLLQRRYVYSFTAKTGDGKTTIALYLAACVAKGTPLAGCEVEKGRVLFFAGENPDDVRTRWIMLCEALGEDPNQMDVVFMPFTPNLSAEAIRAKIDAEATKAGPFSLLIVDTSASYYSGDDENDNVKLGNHARMLRSFVNLPGGPAILVTCHPTKNPDMANLLPRGGGAFLAEVDGNLVAIKDANTMLVEVTTHGKFRGPDFAPLAFKLMPSTSLKLVDSKERPVWSIYAQAISSAERETLKDIGFMEQNKVLRVMLEHPGCSLTEIAQHLGWLTGKREPNKQKVHRLMTKLQKAKLVKQRHDDRYILTDSGKGAAKEIPTDPKNG
jgi:AAA domain-containing protein